MRNPIKFLQPARSISGVRSFLGLANQLSHFILDLASILDPIQQLLKKNNAFVWLKEHEDAFNVIKKTLTTKLSLQHFDPKKPTYIIADTSKLNGLGFILTQSENGPGHPESIIQCGS